MAAVGEPRQNGIDLTEDRDFPEALAQVGQFIDDVYRTKRMHSALGYRTPVEFEAAWQREHDN